MDAPVVVASDPSVHAAEVLRYALRFRPAPLHLFHVHDGPPEGGGTSTRHVDDALGRVAEGVDGVALVWRSSSRPADAIVRYADEVGAGLLVVGTRGRTGIRRLVRGSVAEAVARTAPCDVLAVPLDESDPWSARPTHRVLCAVDLLAGSEGVAARAAEVARRLGADAPRLLHAEDGSVTAAFREVASGPVTLEAAEGVLDGLARRYGGVERGSGSAVEAICGRADVLDADLVVVGTGRRRGAARLLGSVAGRVLRTARRPVLVVPSPTP